MPSDQTVPSDPWKITASGEVYWYDIDDSGDDWA